MARPLKTLRPIPMNISLEEDVSVRLKLELFSVVESRIPHGACSKLINQLLRDHFRLQDVARAKMVKRQKERAKAEADAVKELDHG